MKQIGLLSDTHAFLHPKLFDFFKDVDEIWHAGDIGNLETADKLAMFKPLKAVYGNIDSISIRNEYPKTQIFECESVKVLITHIGGYPKKYDYSVLKLIKKERPKLFICGHSHILKVINDPTHQLLHINPGAAGKSGFHKVSTMIRFNIDQGRIKDLEILELKR